MHLIVYGSEEVGKVTINADGVRVTLLREPVSAGEEERWKPSNTEALGVVRESVARTLGRVLTLLLPAADTREDAPPPNPAPSQLRAVKRNGAAK